MNEIEACLNCTLPICSEESPDCLFIQIQRSEAIEKVRAREHENRLRQARIGRQDMRRQARARFKARAKVVKEVQETLGTTINARRRLTAALGFKKYDKRFRVSGVPPSTGATT